MCLFTNHSSYSACIMVLPLNHFVPPFFPHNCIGIILQLARNSWKWSSCSDFGRTINYRNKFKSSHFVLHILLSVMYNTFLMLVVKMPKLNIWASHFQNFLDPLEACVPVTLGMVDSLGESSPGCFLQPCDLIVRHKYC